VKVETRFSGLRLEPAVSAVLSLPSPLKKRISDLAEQSIAKVS
jgi:hypothetical protein